MKIRVTDITTGTVKIINVSNPIQKRVMSRAVALFQRAKSMNIKGVLLFSFYLKYSWQLEKGHVWA